MSRTIPLSRGCVTVVDDEDYEWLSRRKWRAQPRHLPGGRVLFYAQRTVYLGGGTNNPQYGYESMHRLIMDAGPGEMVDHIDGDGLNNRRSNLRKATPTTNGQNRRPNSNSSSVHKGVSWHKATRKWRVHIRGAYDRAAVEHFGEFARLNFPEGS